MSPLQEDTTEIIRISIGFHSDGERLNACPEHTLILDKDGEALDIDRAKLQLGDDHEIESEGGYISLEVDTFHGTQAEDWLDAHGIDSFYFQFKDEFKGVLWHVKTTKSRRHVTYASMVFYKIVEDIEAKGFVVGEGAASMPKIIEVASEKVNVLDTLALIRSSQKDVGK